MQGDRITAVGPVGRVAVPAWTSMEHLDRYPVEALGFSSMDEMFQVIKDSALADTIA